MALFFTMFHGVVLALRARYLVFLVVMAAILALAVLLAAQFSGRQPSTVALDSGISLIRIFLPFMAIFMTIELVSKEFDRRYYLCSFAYPRARDCFVVGRLFSVVFLTLFALFFWAVVLFALVFYVRLGYGQATPVAFGWKYFAVISFLMVEVLVVSAFSALLAVVAKSQGFVVLCALSFVLVSRSFVGVIELLGRDSTLVANAEAYSGGVGLLSYFLPDLGGLDIRMVSLYGRWDFLPDDYFWVLVSNFSYFCVCLCISVLVIKRRQFS